METITGTVEMGVMCPVVQGDDGELYSVQGLPDALRSGDRVVLEVSATPSPFAGMCDQGTNIDWIRVTRPGRGDRPAATWIRDD